MDTATVTSAIGLWTTYYIEASGFAFSALEQEVPYLDERVELSIKYIIEPQT